MSTPPLPLRLLLAALILFLCVVLAVATAGHLGWLGASFIILDSKNILTGHGTVLALLISALFAVILFVWFTGRSIKPELPHPSHEDPVQRRICTEWLAQDVLGLTTAPTEGWTVLEGTYRGRRAIIERLDAGVLRVTLALSSPFDLSVSAYKGAPAAAADPAVTTLDDDFESACAWQSSVPPRAMEFLRRANVTKALTAVCTALDDDNHPSLLVQSDTIVARMPRSHSASAYMYSLALTNFLALCAEGATPAPAHRPTSSFLAHLAGCVFITLSIVAPIGLFWTGGAYLVARFFGLWAGMTCFFLPLFLLALFAFTRSDKPSTDKITDEQFYATILGDDAPMFVSAYDRRLEEAISREPQA